MEDLHRDAPARGMDGIGDAAVIGDVRGRKEPGGAGEDAAFGIGRHAAGDDETGAALCAGGVEGGDAGPVARLLEPGMHRAHEDAVRERHMAEIEGREEAGIGGHGRAPAGRRHLGAGRVARHGRRDVSPPQRRMVAIRRP